MSELIELIVLRYNYWVYIVLLMIGLYAMIAKKNLIKKLIGMSIFQTAIILFYVSMGVKENATIPIIDHQIGHAQSDDARAGGGVAIHAGRYTLNPEDYANPLPHVLMLTAIVVGVSTLGVALAVVQKVHAEYGTIEEDEILAQIRSGRG